MRTKIDLNGLWDYRVGLGEYGKIQVPFSKKAVGQSVCRRYFDRPAYLCERIFLIFEGTTYFAKAYLNGNELGSMRAYGEYRFDITPYIKEQQNELLVEIEDIDVEFGPSEGWENYGGIIRDVYLECTGKYAILDAFFHAEVNVEEKNAICTVELEHDFPTGAEISCTLYDEKGAVVACGATKETVITFNAANLSLWSPDTPTLYTLVVGGEGDEVIMKVGFKKLETRGRQFYLNNEPLFLFGVCRHDLYGERGHTAHEGEMRADMELIKSTGMNFVRLVHYPHSKRIVELADELGLLISEEPGLWWSDMKNKDICDGALDILANVIRRDRSNVSIAFWLSFNECVFTEEFIRDSARVARENDPTRLVSGANCMTLEMTKNSFKKYGFDFYTMHPYTYYMDTFHEFCNTLDDMPLVFTEWGGFFTHDNPRLLNEELRTLIQLYRDGKLAGISYWQWAKIYEFNRGAEGCFDGKLCESLVEMDRTPSRNFETFKQTLADFKKAPPREWSMRTLPLASDTTDCRTVSLASLSENEENKATWRTLAELGKKPARAYQHNKRECRPEHLAILPELPRTVGDVKVELVAMPVLVSDSVTVELTGKAARLYLFGNVALPYAYPLGGKLGERMGQYTVTYADGSEERWELQNARDITTAWGLHGPSRIDPQCPNAPRAIEYAYDYDFEQYIVNVMTLPLDPQKELRSIRVDAEKDTTLLLYGITLS